VCPDLRTRHVATQIHFATLMSLRSTRIFGRPTNNSNIENSSAAATMTILANNHQPQQSFKTKQPRPIEKTPFTRAAPEGLVDWLEALNQLGVTIVPVLAKCLVETGSPYWAAGNRYPSVQAGQLSALHDQPMNSAWSVPPLS
jgi:hypothetical protein